MTQPERRLAQAWKANQAEVVALIATFALTWLAPWWSVALPALAIGASRRSLASGLWRAAVIGGFVWLAFAAGQDLGTGGRVSMRIGGAFDSPAPRLAAYAMTSAISAVLCALAAWVGHSARDLAWSWPDPRDLRSDS